MQSRQTTLENLLSWNAPLSQLKESLAQFSWDWNGEPLVILQRDQISQVLQRFLRDEITATELEDWANLLEGREDIAFDANAEELVNDCIYRLANPLMTTVLKKNVVQEMLVELKA